MTTDGTEYVLAVLQDFPGQRPVVFTDETNGDTTPTIGRWLVLPLLKPGSTLAGLCTLALLSSATSDPAGPEGSDASGREGPTLLPDNAVAAATGRGTAVLETVTHTGSAPPRRRPTGRGVPLGSLFSRRLRWSLAGLVACVLGLAVASRLTTGDHLLHAGYVVLLDLFAINDPALGETPARQVLQLLSALAGFLLLPVLFAAGLEDSAPSAPPPSFLALVKRRDAGLDTDEDTDQEPVRTTV